MLQIYRFWCSGEMHYPQSYEVMQDAYAQNLIIRFLSRNGELITCEPTCASEFTGVLLQGVPIYEGDILRIKSQNATGHGVVRKNSAVPETYEVHFHASPEAMSLSECISQRNVQIVGNIYETKNAGQLLMMVTLHGSHPPYPTTDESIFEEEITIYTDGCCLVNPGGDGGWAYIKITDGKETRASGYIPETTNNIAELTAVIESLKSVEGKNRTIHIHSDSKYVISAFNEGWLSNWKRNGWITSSGNAVKNIGLWTELDILQKKHNCTWTWVKGHADNKYNIACDKMAGTAATTKRALKEGA